MLYVFSAGWFGTEVRSGKICGNVFQFVDMGEGVVRKGGT